MGPEISSDDLDKTIDTVNASYQKLTINHFYDTTAPDATHDNLGPQPRGQRIFYRSDHYNFAKVGIPICVLHHRAAPGLPSSHRFARQNGLQGDAGGVEDHFRNGVGSGESSRETEVEEACRIS